MAFDYTTLRNSNSLTASAEKPSQTSTQSTGNNSKIDYTSLRNNPLTMQYSNTIGKLNNVTTPKAESTKLYEDSTATKKQSFLSKLLVGDKSSSYGTRWANRGVGKQTDGILGGTTSVNAIGKVGEDGNVTYKTKMDYANELEEKYANDVNKNNFFGKFETNYDLGTLQEEINLATTEYLEDPTEENYEYLEKVKSIYTKYAAANQGTAGQGGAISKDIASYLPQLKNQVGTLANSFGENPVIGANPLMTKVGMTASSGTSSYNDMYGSAFNNLTQYTEDEALARDAAQEEAVISSVIEMAETGITLGVGIGKSLFPAAASASTEVAKSFVQKLATEAGKYGLNIATEGNEEAMQQIVSQANQMRIKDGKGDGGYDELLSYCVKVLDKTYGEDKDSEESQTMRQETKEAARAGRTIAAILGLAETGAGHVMQNINTTETTTTAQPVVEEDTLNTVISDMDSAKKAANTILNNETLRAEFEAQYGKIEGSSKTEQVNKLAERLHQISIAETDTAPTITEAPETMPGANNAMAQPSAVENAAHPMAQPEANMSATQSYVRGLIMNSEADEILSNPEYISIYEQLTGKTLPRKADGTIDVAKARPEIMKTGRGTFDSETELASRAVETNQNTTTNPLTQNNAETPLETQNPLTQQINQPNTENATRRVKPGVSSNTEATTTQNTQNAPVMDAENGAAYAESMPESKGGERTHQYTENESQSSSIDPELREKIKETLKQYGVKTNKATVTKAVNIMAEGTEKAASVIEGRLTEAKLENKKMHPEDAPLAVMVANELTKAGQVDRANAIMSDMAVELTAAGQFIQAVRIMRNVTSPTAFVDTVQKAIDKINKAMSDKGLNYKAEMTEDEKATLSQIDPTDMDAFKAEYKAIMDRVGAEMPSTVLEKAREIRHVNMLLNPRTLITNVAANVPTMAIRVMDDKLSGLMQDIAVKMGKLDPADQTKTVKVADKEKRNVAKEVFKNYQDELTDNTGKYEFSDSRTIFKTHPVKIGNTELRLGGLVPQAIENVVNFAKAEGDQISLDKSSMEYLRRTTYKLLELGDIPFVKMAFVDSLANYMEAHNMNSIEDVTPEAIAHAQAAADYYTYKCDNLLADGVNKLKSIPGVGEVADVIQPFTKTPANIGMMVVQHDPIIGGVISGVKAIKGDTLGAMDAASRAATGAAIMGIGYALRALGWVTGGEDEDDDKAAMDAATGNASYSIGGKYSYDWAEPGGSMLAFGADLYDIIANNKDEGVKDALLKAVFSKGDAFFNMGMMQNISKILQSSYGSPTETLVTNSIENLFSQFVPGISSKVAQAMDSKNRATYSKDNTLLQNAWNKVRVGLPGEFFGIGRETLPESVNVKGETETRGDALDRALSAFVLPGQYNHGEMTDADAYIYGLYERTGNKTIFPEKAPYSVEFDGNEINMTAEERATYQKTMSDTYFSTFGDLFDSGVLDEIDDDTTIKLMSKIRSYASDLAKAELAKERGLEYESDIQTLINGEERVGEDRTALDKDNVPTYFALGQALNTAIAEKDYDTLDQLVKVYGACDDNLQTVIDERLNSFKQFLKASEAGIGAETWMAYNDALDNVQEEEDTTSDGSRLKYKAIVNSGLSSEEVQKLVDMDDELSQNWKTAHNVLTSAGYSPEDVYDFFYNADMSYSADENNQYTIPASDGKLSAMEIYATLQHMDISESEKKALFNAFAEQGGEAGRYNGSWSYLNKKTGKYVPYTYDRCKQQTSWYTEQNGRWAVTGDATTDNPLWKG